MRDLLQLIVRNLRRDLRRTILTTASIVATVFLLVALLAVYNTLTAAVNDPGARQVLGLQERNSANAGELPVSYLERVAATDGVEGVLPWSYVFAGLESLVRIQGIATAPEVLPSVMPPIVEGIPEAEYRSFMANPKGVLMGREAMREHKWKLGDTLSLLGGSLATDFPVQIEGELAFPLLADNFIMHHAYYQTLLDASCGCQAKGSVNMIFFLVSEPELVSAVEESIRREFSGQPVEVELITVVDYVGSLLSQSGDISTLVLLLAVVICLATLLVLGNTLTMAARERTRELAILRALGFGGWQVATVVTGEALALCLLGGTLGGAAAYGAFHFTGFSLDMGPQSYFTVGQFTVFESVGLVLVIGFLAGLPASLRALAIDVVNTLRGVG